MIVTHKAALFEANLVGPGFSAVDLYEMPGTQRDRPPNPCGLPNSIT